MSLAALTEQETGQIYGPATGFLILFSLPLVFVGLVAGALFGVAVNEGAPVGMAITGCVVTLVGIGLWFLVIRPWRRSVELFDDRLIYRNCEHQTEVAFDEIDQLYRSAADVCVYGAKVTSTAGCRLIDIRGQTYVFNGLIRNAGEIGRVVEAAAFERLYEECMAGLSRGEQVDFGAVQVSITGLQRKRRTLPWSDVGAWDVMQGMLTLESATQKPITCRVCDIANFRVFLAVVDQCR